MSKEFYYDNDNHPENEPDGLEMFEEIFKNEDQQTDDSESELAAIRAMLEELGIESNLEVTLIEQHSVGSPNALAHRIDRVFFVINVYLNDVSMAIQTNTFNEYHAEVFYNRITDTKVLERLPQKEAELLLRNLYSLLEIYHVDPQQVFINNFNSSQLFASTLLRTIDSIKQWVDTYPERNIEEVAAKTYLLEKIKAERDLAINNWKKDRPDHEQFFETQFQILLNIVEKIDSNLTLSKGYLDRILELIRSGFIGLDVVSFDISVNEDRKADLILLLENLINQ